MQEVGICLLYMRAQVGGNKWCVSETGWTQSKQTSEINCRQMKSRPCLVLPELEKSEIQKKTNPEIKKTLKCKIWNSNHMCEIWNKLPFENQKSQNSKIKKSTLYDNNNKKVDLWVFVWSLSMSQREYKYESCFPFCCTKRPLQWGAV